jgi:hypothetical protein
MKRSSSTFLVFLLAFIAYAISSQVWAHPISLAPHYVYLAHSLLHGHVDLIQLPPVTYDLLQYNSHWYVAGSPMPSILMLPFVAIFGVNFSDVLFSVVLGAINVALVYSLLGKFINHGDTENTEKYKSLRASVVISESSRRWLTLLFALGTPQWYLAALGTYWFTAHTVTIFFTLLATREALTKQRWFLSGLWLACAGFARPTALALIPFFAILIIKLDAHWDERPSDLIKLSSRLRAFVVKSIPFIAAIIIGLAAHGLYNTARFGSIGDFGYSYVAGAENITSTYAKYGGFNPRFLPCDLSVSLLAPPEINGWVPGFIKNSCDYLIQGANISDTSAPIVPNPLGMSIFIVTPALLLVFNARRRDPIIIAAWLGFFATMIPLWMYHNTGSLQFGYRYLFDAAPMWLILLAAGIGEMKWWKRGLILISIAINLWGFWWMFEKLVGVKWFG